VVGFSFFWGVFLLCDSEWNVLVRWTWLLLITGARLEPKGNSDLVRLASQTFAFSRQNHPCQFRAETVLPGPVSDGDPGRHEGSFGFGLCPEPPFSCYGRRLTS